MKKSAMVESALGKDRAVIDISSSSDGEKDQARKGKTVMPTTMAGQTARNRPLRRLPRPLPPVGASVQIVFSDSSEEEALDKLNRKFAQLGVQETKQLSANVQVQTDISIPSRFFLDPSDLKKVTGEASALCKVPFRMASKSHVSASVRRKIQVPSLSKAPISKVRKQIFGHAYEVAKAWNPSPLPSSGSPSPCKDPGGIGKEDAKITIPPANVAEGLLETFGVVYDDHPSAFRPPIYDHPGICRSEEAKTVCASTNSALSSSSSIIEEIHSSCPREVPTRVPAYNTCSRKLEKSVEK